MSTTPEISGYRREQLLDHPLASVARYVGQRYDVVALVLSETGAADRAVRDRLAASSRIAAVQSGRRSHHSGPPTERHLPVRGHPASPGYSGAERLLDPLDGVIGNDQSAIEEVRRRLDGGGTQADSPAAGRRLWAAAIVIPLIVFVVAYSAGAAINSAAARPEPTSPKVPVPDAVQPTPLASKKVLLPGISKAGQVPLRGGVRLVSLVASTSELSPMPWDKLGLPFAMHIPGPEWLMKELEESSYSIYRQRAGGQAWHGGGRDRRPPVQRPGRLPGRPDGVRCPVVGGTASRHRPRRVTVRPGSARTPRGRALQSVADQSVPEPGDRVLVAGRRRGERRPRQRRNGPGDPERYPDADLLTGDPAHGPLIVKGLLCDRLHAPAVLITLGRRLS